MHLFWGDDRFVPADDPSSNIRMVREALLDHVPVPAINVHPMPVFFHDPAAAAADYEATLKSYWRGTWPRLDVMLLGLGADGHTASLFPHGDALTVEDAFCTPATAPDGSPRLTVTAPVINAARRVWFLVSGAAKAGIVAEVIEGLRVPMAVPAQGVAPVHGSLTWFLDEAAAAELSPDARA